MECKCCNSPYLDFIEMLLHKNTSTREISRRLKEEYGVYISHGSINNHRRYHFLKPRDNIVSLLYETGNYILVRKILRTEKVVKQYPKCSCSPYSDRPLRMKGLVFICSVCNGWVEGNIGRQIKHRRKKERRDEPLTISMSFNNSRY